MVDLPGLVTYGVHWGERGESDWVRSGNQGSRLIILLFAVLSPAFALYSAFVIPCPPLRWESARFCILLPLHFDLVDVVFGLDFVNARTLYL